MIKIEKLHRQNPKLNFKPLKDGRGSLHLDFYIGRSQTPVLDGAGNPLFYTSGSMKGKQKFKIKHIRHRESLGLYIWLSPHTKQQRIQNRETIQLASRIRFEREQQMTGERWGYCLQYRKQDFLEYYRRYFEDNPGLSPMMKCSIRQSYNKFKNFLEESETYRHYHEKLPADRLTPKMMTAFADYLKSHGTGEGPKGMLGRLKKVIKSALGEGVLRENPCEGIKIKWDKNIQIKEILSPEEVRMLMSTHFDRENKEVQRAFIFSLFTGVRWCDVKKMTFANVDTAIGQLRFQQQKVCGISNHSYVGIPLNEEIMRLIGIPKTKDRDNEKIFSLGSYNTCNKYLKKWVKAAGIAKKISWHCARHTFAVNLLTNGADIKTVADLMGHSSIKMTEKYLHTVDNLKKQAIDSLGPISYTQ